MINKHRLRLIRQQRAGAEVALIALLGRKWMRHDRTGDIASREAYHAVTPVLSTRQTCKPAGEARNISSQLSSTHLHYDMEGPVDRRRPPDHPVH